MKTVYLLRHAEAERGVAGLLTARGQESARNLAKMLPRFAKTISSDTSRTKQTALLLTGTDPAVDERAGFYLAPPAKGEALMRLAIAKNSTFFEAVIAYDDPEVMEGVAKKAEALNRLVDETLSDLQEGEAALVVSHDMTIASAMALKGVPEDSMEYLSGYTIADDGAVSRFRVKIDR